MNPAVKNENGPLAGDPLSKKQNRNQVNVSISSQKVTNSACSFCNSDITSSIPAEEMSGIGENFSCPYISKRSGPETV